MASLWDNLNPFLECRKARLTIWQCPPFLFVIMGSATIISMVVTYVLASDYTSEPQIAALAVILVAAIFFIVGNLIIAGFNKIAEANHMKEEFVALVSHQLRSPLSIFKWTLDVLERDITNAPDHTPASLNFLQTLRDTNENMIRMVNTLLEVNRIDAHTFLLKKELFSLEELTKKIVDDFRKFGEASNVSVRVASSGHLPQLLGDRDRIGVVIQNLLDNAIRYTKTSGTIIIKVGKKGNTLSWSIQDEGIGIPEAQQKYIFQKFFRADNIRDHQTRGSGIGLYLAQAIIGASGGEIGFNSKTGEGSIFWFSLPIGKENQKMEKGLGKL